jgi:ABC-type transport system substrate-binding protein
MFPSARCFNFVFDEAKQPLQDVHVRRARSCALDRQIMVKAELYGDGEVVASILTFAMPHHDARAGRACPS